MKTFGLRFSSFVVAALAAQASAAVPSVSDVTLSQDGLTRAVTVNYTLADEPAIITLDICTNGVSIGQNNVWAIDGDANRVVQPGSRSLVWHPDKSWPNQKFASGDGIELTAVVTAWATNDPPMYLAADLVTGDVSYYTCAEAVPGGVPDVHRSWYLDKLWGDQLLHEGPTTASACGGATTFGTVAGATLSSAEFAEH